MEVGGQHHVPAVLPPGKDPVPIVWRWAPGPVWTDAENLDPIGIRSSDRPGVAIRYTDWAIPAQCNYLVCTC